MPFPAPSNARGAPTPLDNWLADLAYADFPTELFRAGELPGTRPYASEIEELLDPGERGIGASAVFCVGNLPAVCFVDGTALPTNRVQRIEEIRQRVWNQNLASIVLVVDSDYLTAYSVNSRDAEPEALGHTSVDRSGQWSAYEIQSGFVNDRLPQWFSPDERVDQRLLVNLREVVQRLERSGLNDKQAEALMAQVIFLCYLEQRGIVGNAYREKHGFDVLDALVSRRDGKKIDRLLRQLGTDFNGDFLRSNNGGAPRWAELSKESFDSIQQFLDGVDLSTGQGSFWRYDFSRIPVELISGIYETLLKKRQEALGAFYTPRHLANLVVEQAFEGIANPSACTVYDGASGSGILLTTAFRRMLRHAEVVDGKRLRLRSRIELMRKNIFGNDIDETACWITAFSLYLSLLEGLDPADISLLQTDEDLKLPPLVGEGLNIQRGSKYGDFFSPANPFSGKKRFDVFICNPPWRESADDDTPVWEDWLRVQDPPYPIGRRQIASGFAYRATSSVRDNGVIVLIMPLNLMVGATKQSCEFRQRWLEEARIYRVINFADVRRLLFPAAKHPCAIVRARPRPRVEGAVFPNAELIEYWTPKADMSLALGRIAIHEADQKRLLTRDVYGQPYALVSHYWGDKRDVNLLRRLLRFGTLAKTMASRPQPWISGKGFHAANKSNPDRDLGELQGLPYLSAKRLPAAYPVLTADAQLDNVEDHFPIVASPGGQDGLLYDGPRVVFSDGLLEDLTVKAVFTDVKLAFQSSLGAIGARKVDANLIKFLTAYLRSPLAGYLLVMTGYSVIGERPRNAVADLKAFPFCAPETHPDPKRARAIITKVAELYDRIAATSEWIREHAYSKVQDELTDLIYSYFRISDTERILVTDTIKYIATSIQPQDHDHLSTPLLHRTSRPEIDAYVSVLAKELATWRNRRGGEGSLKVEAIVEGTGGFFGAVRVALSGTSEDSEASISSKSAFRSLMRDIQSGLRTQASLVSPDDLFKIPNIMVLVDDVFFFVKPLRRRFWMAKSALADADTILQSIQAVAWAKG